MQSTKQHNTDGPRSLMRIFKMLEAIARSPKGLTLTELSQQLQAPKSSLLVLLRPLVHHYYLNHEGGKYGLGSEVFQLSAEILSARSFTRIIRPFLEELNAATTESVYLVIINRDMGLASYIEGIESQNPVRYVAPPGTVRPLHVSAAGRVLLAFQEESWRERYIETTALITPSTHQPIDPDELREDLAEVRRTGIAISMNAAISGAGGMAAPIMVANQPVSAALLISAPAERLERSTASFRNILTKMVRRVSTHLTGINYQV